VGLWASDTFTLSLLTAFGVRTKTTAPKKSAAQTYLRKPVARRPSIPASPSIFGPYNEGIMPGDGDGESGGISATAPGAQGQDISTMTAAQIASNITTTAQLTLSTFTTGLAIAAAPVTQAVAQALRGLAVALGLAGKATSAAAEGQVTLSNPAGSAEFAAENPTFAGLFAAITGIHLTAQPSAAQLADEAAHAHAAQVAAELGISDTANQGFAFEGGYVDINGNAIGPASLGRSGEIGTLATSETEVEVDGNPGALSGLSIGQISEAAAADAAAAAAADAAAAGSAAAAAADAGAAAAGGVSGESDGGGGGGGTGDGGGGGDGGGDGGD
jgi:hypothetical protein